MIRKVLLGIQAAQGLVLTVGRIFYQREPCAHYPRTCIVDILYPPFWSIALVIIILSIIKRKWFFILYPLLIAGGAYLGRIGVDSTFDIRRSRGQDIGSYYKNNDNHHRYDYLERVWITLYPDYYTLDVLMSPDAGCTYMGKYGRSGNVLCFDDKIVTETESFISSTVFIVRGDTLIAPGDTSMYLIDFSKN